MSLGGHLFSDSDDIYFGLAVDFWLFLTSWLLKKLGAGERPGF